MALSNPYPVTIHYDPTIEDGKLWTGSGKRMHAACCNPQWIVASGDQEQVDCLSCKRTKTFKEHQEKL